MSTNIDEVIEFLQKKKKEGYKSVEIIDDARASGWFLQESEIVFVFNKNEPNVVGIDARIK